MGVTSVNMLGDQSRYIKDRVSQGKEKGAVAFYIYFNREIIRSVEVFVEFSQFGHT